MPLAVDGTATSPVALYSEPLYDSNIAMLDAMSWLVDHVIYQSLLQCRCAEHSNVTLYNMSKMLFKWRERQHTYLFKKSIM